LESIIKIRFIGKAFRNRMAKTYKTYLRFTAEFEGWQSYSKGVISDFKNRKTKNTGVNEQLLNLVITMKSALTIYSSARLD